MNGMHWASAAAIVTVSLVWACSSTTSTLATGAAVNAAGTTASQAAGGGLPPAGALPNAGNAALGGGAGNGLTASPGITEQGVAAGAAAAAPGTRPGGAQGPTDWAMFGYDPGNTRNNTSETRLSPQTVPGLKKRWTRAVGEGRRGLTSTPIVVGDTIYVCEHPGVLATYAAKTGTPKWRKAGLGSIRCGTPLVTGDRVYVSAGSALHAFLRSDGTKLWSSPSYGVKLSLTDSSPVMAGDKIVVGVGTFEVINAPPYSDKGVIVAFNQDGKLAWKFTPAGTETTGISVWSSPAVDEARGLMFIGTGQAYQMPAGPNSDALLAIEYATGKLRWRNQFHAGDTYTDGNASSGGTRLDYDIGASPNLMVAKGIDAVAVGSKGALFRAVNRDTGETIWETKLGNPSALGGVMAVAAVAEGRIFVAHRLTGALEGGTSQMRALSVDDGSDVWPSPVALPGFVWGAVTHANGVVYTSIHKTGELFALDARDGKKLWMTTLANGAAGGPSVSNGWLYVPSGYTGLGPNTAGADLTAFSLDDGTAIPVDPGPAGGTAGAGAMQGGAAFRKVMTALNNCVGGFCHGAAGGLNFQTTLMEQYTALVGMDRKGAPAGDATTTGKCAGKKRIVPRDPASSVLYQKISNMPSCGEAMPTPGSGMMMLGAAEVAVVRDWIMAGAPFD